MKALPAGNDSPDAVLARMSQMSGGSSSPAPPAPVQGRKIEYNLFGAAASSRPTPRPSTSTTGGEVARSRLGGSLSEGAP